MKRQKGAMEQGQEDEEGAHNAFETLDELEPRVLPTRDWHLLDVLIGFLLVTPLHYCLLTSAKVGDILTPVTNSRQ